jgi:hypothetical protein
MAATVALFGLGRDVVLLLAKCKEGMPCVLRIAGFSTLWVTWEFFLSRSLDIALVT